MDVDMDVDGDDDGADEEAGLGNDDDDDDEDMPIFFKELGAVDEVKTPSRNPKSKVAVIVRTKIDKVLESTGLADKRARMCDQNDFLKLLIGTPPSCHRHVRH